jgi:predicted enzyme related to lactoylglutathione lyase
MVDREIKIVDVIVDCADPARVAAFWSELLGRPIAGSKGPYVWLERTDGVGFGFQRTGEPKRGKNRMHIDIEAPDVGAATQQIEALGGSRIPGYESGGFLVMADPEGNEFCLIPREPFNLDDQGRADYLDDPSER